MNRSFRASESGGRVGNLRLKDGKDEDLALFREMRRREKERNDLLMLQNSDEFEAPLGPTSGNSPIFNLGLGGTAPTRKPAADDFLNADNDKNDYDWLLTPPSTPLFPSLEMESQKTVMSQLGSPKARPAALKSRLANPQPEPPSRTSLPSRQQTSSNGGLRRPSSSGGSGSRPSTPTGRPVLNPRPSLPSSSSKPSAKPATSSSRATPHTGSKQPSRSSTPTSRPTLTSSKPAGPPRSSTPTSRATARPTTPTNRASMAPSNPTPRASTPTRRPSTLPSTASIKSPTTSTSLARPASVSSSIKNPLPTRPGSPSARPKPWKPSEMPGYSLDAPPNLRTSLSDRPPSVTRGRPGAPSSRSSSIEPVSNGRVRRQSCSPARGRPPNGLIHASGGSVPVHGLNRLHAKANDSISPGLVGAKMVERVINMRKLIPPKQDDRHSPRSNLSGKSSSSPEGSGFGRTLSKKSLDMAIRHMDIRRAVPGNLRPLMANIPVSSMYSVRSGPNRTRNASVSDSPLATSSNASSEVSASNNSSNALCANGHEGDDDVSSRRGIRIRSPSSFHER